MDEIVWSVVGEWRYLSASERLCTLIAKEGDGLKVNKQCQLVFSLKAQALEFHRLQIRSRLGRPKSVLYQDERQILEGVTWGGGENGSRLFHKASINVSFTSRRQQRSR